jgi:hypothetical protein
MDPNETLKQISQHLEAGDTEAAKQGCLDLAGWMSKGGFNPTWDKYPEATTYYGKLSKEGVV